MGRSPEEEVSTKLSRLLNTPWDELTPEEQADWNAIEAAGLGGDLTEEEATENSETELKRTKPMEPLADIDLDALIEVWERNPSFLGFPEAVLACLLELKERRRPLPSEARVARDALEALELIKIDLEAGDLPAKARVKLALNRTKAWIAEFRACSLISKE